MPIQIHGKSYNTVAERILKAGNNLVEVKTEVLNQDPVVIKATIKIARLDANDPTGFRIFTGISSANANKSIEKESPYEVAETSAVGRALAFAGYETTNGIASSLEILKSERENTVKTTNNDEVVREPINTLEVHCGTCNSVMTEMKGTSSKTGKPYHFYKCPKDPTHPLRNI